VIVEIHWGASGSIAKVSIDNIHLDGVGCGGIETSD